MIFGRKRRPAPCPACDAEIDPTRIEDDACPECGQPLVPVVVAGFWRRALAFSVDCLVLAVTAGPLHYLLTRVVPVPDLAEGSSGLDAMFRIVTADVGALLGYFAPLLIMSLVYFGLFLAVTGKTPGQSLLHVRVVDRSGDRPGPVIAAIRLAATVAGLFPGALGALWMAFDMEKRAFHDHVAGTYVVRET